MQNVTLRSAARLEQDQEFEIAKQMQEATKSKNIKIKPVVDESLMGGFIVEWGDNQVRPSAVYFPPFICDNSTEMHRLCFPDFVPVVQQWFSFLLIGFLPKA